MLTPELTQTSLQHFFHSAAHIRHLCLSSSWLDYCNSILAGNTKNLQRTQCLLVGRNRGDTFKPFLYLVTLCMVYPIAQVLFSFTEATLMQNSICSTFPQSSHVCWQYKSANAEAISLTSALSELLQRYDKMIETFDR